MTLHAAQETFWRAARRETSAQEVRDTFLGTEAFDAAARMNVYAGAYFGRQLDVLAELFEKTRRHLGEAFRGVALDYIRRHPSTSAAIERIGAGFSEALAKTPQIDARASGLAALEWARLESLLSPDPVELLSVAALALADPGDVLRAAPSVRLVASTHESLRLFLRPGHELQADRTHILFFRPRFAVCQRVVAHDEAHAIEALVRGEPVSSICEAFAGADEPARRAHHVLSRWLREQLLVAPPPGCGA